jgi:SNF2 family DNA or RNA helicase
MLDLLEAKLKEAKFNYRRLDGTMSVLARDRAVSEFKTMPEVNVIIMSLKAASLGLNMVAACHVLLLDVWWNPTTEDQAIDRAHRIGQTRPVIVSRFTVKNTIEDRILELQVRHLSSYGLTITVVYLGFSVVLRSITTLEISHRISPERWILCARMFFCLGI